MVETEQRESGRGPALLVLGALVAMTLIRALHLGQLDEAGEHLRADLEIRRALVEEEPAKLGLREHLVDSLNHMGKHLFMQGRPSSSPRSSQSGQRGTLIV